jgi:hypothetical protein
MTVTGVAANTDTATWRQTLIRRSADLRLRSELARERLALARRALDLERPSALPIAVPRSSVDEDLAALRPAQLLAVLDCLRGQALRANSTEERRHAQMAFMVVRAELLSREYPADG